jgi:uncharacterized membrane protein YkgB
MYEELAYKAVLKASREREFLDEVMKDPNGKLNSMGISETEKIYEVVEILTPLNTVLTIQQGFMSDMKKQADQTLEVATEMKNGLRSTIDQINKAYLSTMLMYKVSFYLGVLLVLVAVAYAIFIQKPLLPLVFGGLGVGDFIAFFITKPPERLQDSRANLAQLQTALFNWFTDLVNQNSLMQLLLVEKKLDLPTMEKLSETLMAHTEKTMELIQKFCE